MTSTTTSTTNSPPLTTTSTTTSTTTTTTVHYYTTVTTSTATVRLFRLLLRLYHRYWRGEVCDEVDDPVSTSELACFEAPLGGRRVARLLSLQQSDPCVEGVLTACADTGPCTIDAGAIHRHAAATQRVRVGNGQ